jgi:hypothetical protein
VTFTHADEFELEAAVFEAAEPDGRVTCLVLLQAAVSPQTTSAMSADRTLDTARNI